MPLREVQCETCGYKLTELVRARDYDDWRADVDGGQFTHVVRLAGEDAHHTEHICGTFRFVPSLPADYLRKDGYPFLTAPWLLPPIKGEDGKYRLNRVEITGPRHYKRVLKEHGMIAPLADSEKLTMYGERRESKESRMQKMVDGDVKFYHEMRRDPHAAKRIIEKSVKTREAAGL